MAEVEKIICTEGGYNAADMAALMNNNRSADMMAFMNNNNWNNNPFMMLVFLAFLGNNGFGWGNNRGDWQANANLSRQMQDLQGTVTDNHNNDIALQAINGNRDAISQLAQTLNTSTQNVQTAICGVKSAIEQVAGKVGYSAEAVKNAIALGDANIIQQMQSCCCQQKELIQRMGYESQLATERQTNVLASQMAAQTNTLASQMSANHSADQLKQCEYHGQTMNRIDQLANGITQGLASIGYENAKNTQDIINAGNANTQRILDVMCQNTTQQLRDAIAEKDRQLQTANIVSQLKKDGCNCGC